MTQNQNPKIQEALRLLTENGFHVTQPALCSLCRKPLPATPAQGDFISLKAHGVEVHLLCLKNSTGAEILKALGEDEACLNGDWNLRVRDLRPIDKTGSRRGLVFG